MFITINKYKINKSIYNDHGDQLDECYKILVEISKTVKFNLTNIKKKLDLNNNDLVGIN